MKVELGIGERLALLGVLPPEGDVVTMRVLRDFKHEVELSADEIKDRGVMSEGGQVRWNEGEAKKELEVSDSVLGIIKSALKKMDTDKKVTEFHLSLFDVFEV